MSRAQWLSRLAIPVACLVIVPPRVVGQTAPTVAEQTARVARLDHLQRLASAAADSAAKAVAARWSLDTVRVGPFTVLTDPAGAAVVRAGVDLAWRQLAPTFGGDTTLIKSEWLFVDFRDTPARPKPPGRGDVPVAWSHVGSLVDTRPSDVAWEVEDFLSAVFGGYRWRGSSFTWVGDVFLHVPLPRDSTLHRETYVELVTAAWQSTHRCFDGDIASCRVALGVDSVADPLTVWYTPAERRALARRFPSTRAYSGPDGQPVWTRCTVEQDDASCTAFLRALAQGGRPLSSLAPLSLTARRSLILTAVSLGGSGAYTRLVTDRTMPLGDRLAAAARVPLDSLIAAWRAQVIAARPLSPEVAGGTQWSTLLWAVLLGVLALRSTRWRSA